jgi:hypothetical protein
VENTRFTNGGKMNRNRPGCLSGLMKLFFLRTGYNWMQRRVGYGRGGIVGCGCGTLLLIIGAIILFSIVFGTNWTDFRFFIETLPMVLLPLESVSTALLLL